MEIRTRYGMKGNHYLPHKKAYPLRYYSKVNYVNLKGVEHGVRLY